MGFILSFWIDYGSIRKPFGLSYFPFFIRFPFWAGRGRKGLLQAVLPFYFVGEGRPYTTIWKKKI